MLCESFVRYSVAQAVGLKEAGANVTLYYVDRLSEFSDDPEERELVLDHARKNGIDVVQLPSRDLKRILTHVWWLHRDLAARRASWLIVHAHIDPRYATLGLRFRVLSFIHDPRPHSGDYESMFPAPVRAMSRVSEVMSERLLLHSDRLVAERRPFVSSVPTIVVPHGTTTREEPVPVPNTPRLVLTGRLMTYKGIDVALEAFRQVREHRPDITLTLAGRGRMGDEIRAANIEGVELVDRYLPEHEMDALIDSARLLLLPYRDATQSGVGLQALGRGIPTVVSDAGALPDLVPEDMATLVTPAGEAAPLAASILEWIDHDQGVRQRLLAFGQENFAWQVVAANLLRELGVPARR